MDKYCHYWLFIILTKGLFVQTFAIFSKPIKYFE